MPQFKLFILGSTTVVEQNVGCEFNFNFCNAKTKIKKNAMQFGGGEINVEYMSDSLDACTWLFINTYGPNIYGFATVVERCASAVTASFHPHLYIDLLCHLPQTQQIKTRQFCGTRILSGKDIIEHVVQFGKRRGIRNVCLSAIDTAILYYWKLGFRFNRKHRQTMSPRTPYLLTTLLEHMYCEKNAKNAKKRSKIIKQIALRHYPGYLSESYQQMMGLNSDLNSDLDSVPINDAFGLGIPMHV
jgi:hypothetical protein